MEAKRVLIVDDETAFANLVKLNLEKTGRYDIGVENDPQAALATARKFKPHLILLDVMMPNKNGGELLAEFEADEQLKEVPVVFLTAALTRQIAEAQQTAVRGRPVIAKPVTPKELARRIDEVLGQSIIRFL